MEEKKKIRKVVLMINREVMTFLIIDKKVFYSDRKFKALIRILPRPRNFVNFIQKSRNAIPAFLTKLFNYTKKEMEEYEKAKDDAELAEIICLDGKKNGCIVAANGLMEVDQSIIDDIQKVEVLA